ncbi:hypothetical protein [Saliterribacillus persicus]|uniref:Tfp pilus assembly protein PilN n=1 Tax=Saliterribacillus persicus TaxID=930114 RepID=A0A368XFJ0_9BACI|nr:hypothetical protein [Saliterribacillus persicus]RCW66399.1 hypothetical protein DFR57_109120 [Saliterribacillus persicus]
MIEINFIEIKKVNMVPYFLLFLFLLLTASMSAILYWQYQNAEEVLESNQLQLNNNYSVQTEIVNDNQLQQERLQLSDQVKELQTLTFPSVKLKNDLLTLLPSENQVISYLYEAETGVTLNVLLNSFEDIALFTQELTNTSYVEDVLVSEIFNLTDQSPNMYDVIVEIKIDDLAYIKEVE